MITGASKCNFINCFFDINNTQDNIYNFSSSKGRVVFTNCIFKNINNTPYVLIKGTGRLFFDKSITNSKLRILEDAKMLIHYSNYNELIGNTQNNCHIDNFDME